MSIQPMGPSVPTTATAGVNGNKPKISQTALNILKGVGATLAALSVGGLIFLAATSPIVGPVVALVARVALLALGFGCITWVVAKYGRGMFNRTPSQVVLVPPRPIVVASAAARSPVVFVPPPPPPPPAPLFVPVPLPRRRAASATTAQLIGLPVPAPRSAPAHVLPAAPIHGGVPVVLGGIKLSFKKPSGGVNIPVGKEMVARLPANGGNKTVVTQNGHVIPGSAI